MSIQTVGQTGGAGFEGMNAALSRPVFLASTGLAAAAWGSSRVFGQPGSQPAAPATAAGLVERARKGAETAKITLEKLRGNVSVLMGVGGNIGVLPGKDGAVVVDTGCAGSERQIREALAGLGGARVKYVVNTHWHFDHTDGNEWLHAGGATVIAHENVRKRMSESTRVDLWEHTFPASPAGALPSLTIHATPPGVKDATAGTTIHVNGTSVRLDAYQPAHTDGDVTAHFVDADVLQLGDLWWNGLYPFIDYSTGGSVNGVIRAIESTLARVSDKTLIIPGHGPVGDKAQLSEYRDMLTAVRDRVAALKKQGKSVEEVIAEKPTAGYDEMWGKFVVGGALFTRLVYAGV